jgi:hypothetical protein
MKPIEVIKRNGRIIAAMLEDQIWHIVRNGNVRIKGVELKLK